MPESSFLPHRQPFLYLLGALLCGILLDRFLALSSALLLVLFIFFLLLSATFLFAKKSVSATLFLLCSFVAVGGLLAYAERTQIAENRLQRLLETGIVPFHEPVELTGVLSAPPEPAPDAYFLDVEVESVRVLQETISASGHVRLLTAPADAQAMQGYQQLALDYGSRVRVLVRLEHGRSYKNPGSPDFNEFLERQGYDAKGNIKSPLLIETLGQQPRNQLLAALYHFRLRMMQTIDSRFMQPVAGTLKAMLFGNRYFIDPETSERLRESSTFHVLVISGMHITLIALVLLRLRIPSIPYQAKEEKQRLLHFPVRVLSRYRAKKRPVRPSLWRVTLILLVLWAYVLMVGLAPPVTRAMTMISVGLFAPLFFRQAASVNTVALAAFIMLALKPALVADAGFQLSFIAVAAIVALALPVNEKLRQIGEWRPTPEHPQPPACPTIVKTIGEALFWNERAFQRERQNAPITYHLDKSKTAILLNRFRLQPLLRGVVLLFITSTLIQLATLPLMACYFNRVAPVGILLNLFAGLLTSAIMLGSLTTLITTSISNWMATEATAFVNTAHFLLVHAITPFSSFSFSTFRVAHYEGWRQIIYIAYFVPLGLLAWLIDRWQPVARKQKAVSRRQKTGDSKQNVAPMQNQAAQYNNSFTDGTALPFRRKFMPRGKLLTAYCLLLTLPLALFAIVQPPNRLPRGKLTVYFLDVGQGDSALIVFPQGATMLIDGGGEMSFQKKREPAKEDEEPSETEYQQSGFSVGEAVVCRFLWAMGLRRIDYVVASHADTDHIEGLSPVLKNFAVGQALVGQPLFGNVEFDKLAVSATRQERPLAVLEAGMSFTIEGATVDVLHPSATQQAKTNNNSVVLRFRYGTTSFLFTGDIEKEAEAALIKSGLPLQADILKAPHHGSKTSSTDAFLKAVQPQVAVISVGERSRFGHPHREVVERYQQRGIRLLQTGRNGMIMAQTDGATLSLQTYSP